MQLKPLAGAGLVLAALALTAVPARAQAPAVVSPEVTHTGTAPTGYTVTFRIYDPTATRMRIRGEWFFSGPSDTTPTSSAGRLPSQWQPADFPIANPNNGAAANWPVADMTLDPGTGIWSYTTPMPSGTYTYGFYRNCTSATPNLPGCTEVSDPANPPFNLVGGVNEGAVEPTSQVYVPSPIRASARSTSRRRRRTPVHGTVTDLTYADPESTNPVGQHYVAVYTPPGYDPNRALPYPTLYISHGAGGNEADWFTQGVANRIVDSLIAAGRMQPTVVVSTNFNGLPNGNAGYQNDVLNRVIPFVESHFHVSTAPADRAFAGLSAGGSRANQLIFNATTAFGYYATWSIGTGGAPAAGSPLYANPQLKTAARPGGRRRPVRLDHLPAGQPDRQARPGDAPGRRRRALPRRHDPRRPRVVRVAAAAQPLRREGRVQDDLDRGGGGRAAADGDGHAGHRRARRAHRHGAVRDGQRAAGRAGAAGQRERDARGDRHRRRRGDHGGVQRRRALQRVAGHRAVRGAASGTITGSVPATLALSLGGAPATFGAFTPGVAHDYLATTTATVVSTAGNGTLSVSDPDTVAPGHLVNGAYAMAQPLQAQATSPAGTGGTYATVGGASAPATLLTYAGPASNDPVAIGFKQPVAANDPLRTGTYAKTLTFTLSTTQP